MIKPSGADRRRRWSGLNSHKSREGAGHARQARRVGRAEGPGTSNSDLQSSAFRFSLFVDPFNTDNFWRAIQTQGKKRPSKPAIDIEPAARSSVMPLDPSVTPGRKPERRHAGYAPLASVAMPAEDQIDGVVILQLIEDVRCMGQQQREAVLCAWR